MILFGLVFLGMMAGSVANAVIYRLPRNISWIRGHSKCNHCKHELGFWDLIPILSYLLLGGRCRYCKKSIGSRYLFVELLMGLGFGLLANPLLCAIFWVTIVIAFMDWETKLVSEALVLIWAILVIGSRNINVGGALIGILLIGGIWAITRGKAMGFGDVEIAGVMGLWLGWPKIAAALWVAFIVGGVFGAWQMIRHKKNLKSQIAFGPFLIVGVWVAYFWGDMIIKYVFPI